MAPMDLFKIYEDNKESEASVEASLKQKLIASNDLVYASLS